MHIVYKVDNSVVLVAVSEGMLAVKLCSEIFEIAVFGLFMGLLHFLTVKCIKALKADFVLYYVFCC